MNSALGCVKGAPALAGGIPRRTPTESWRAVLPRGALPNGAVRASSKLACRPSGSSLRRSFSGLKHGNRSRGASRNKPVQVLSAMSGEGEVSTDENGEDALPDLTGRRIALGVDIGGSGIKGALVDLDIGEMVSERYRIPTPEGATPEDVCRVVGEIAKHFEWTGPIGVGFPAAIRRGVVLTAANVSKEWIGVNAEELIKKETGSRLVQVANDADVAGCAEIEFGAAKGVPGLVMMFTFGTGIGAALFIDGKLVPNSELGHILLANGKEAEHYASDAVRSRENLGIKKWGQRVSKVLEYMEALFWPDLMVVGGGVSKKSEKWLPVLNVKTPVVVAEMRNQAGIVGAAAQLAPLLPK